MPEAAGTATTPLLEIDGARATIRLNRPKHLNRLQAEDLGELVKLFDRIEADPVLCSSTVLVARSVIELRS